MNKYDNRYNNESEIIRRLKSKKKATRNLIILGIIMILVYGCAAIININK